MCSLLQFYLQNLVDVFYLSYLSFLNVLHGSHVCCNFADENRIKAGQLGAMEALLEALSLHKANAEVAREVAYALTYICANGIDQRYR